MTGTLAAAKHCASYMTLSPSSGPYLCSATPPLLIPIVAIPPSYAIPLLYYTSSFPTPAIPPLYTVRDHSDPHISLFPTPLSILILSCCSSALIEHISLVLLSGSEGALCCVIALTCSINTSSKQCFTTRGRTL